MEVSRYAHAVLDHDADRTIIFNTLNGAIGALPGAEWPLREWPEDVVEGLRQLGVLLDGQGGGLELKPEEWLDGAGRRSVEIIFETGLGCNLGCNYCYQNSYKDKMRPVIDPAETLEHLVTLARESFPDLRTVRLSLIGGEPLLYRHFVQDALQAVREICAQADLRSTTLINTNATLLRESDVKDFDAIAIAVSRQADHDQRRPRAGGRGSYSQIWRNLRHLAPEFNRRATDLQLRYNAHVENADEFGSFLEDVDALGVRRVKVRAFPVINYEGNGLVIPIPRARIRELNTEAIRWEVRTGRAVRTMPRASLSRCSAYDFATLKVHADGSVSTCDAHLPRGKGAVSEMTSWRMGLKRLFPELDVDVVLSDPECRECKWVAMCGGRTLCKEKGVDSPLAGCDFLDYDLDEFLRIFVSEVKKHPELFADSIGTA